MPDATEWHHRSSLLVESSHLLQRSFGTSALLSQRSKCQQRALNAELDAGIVPWIWHYAAIESPQHNLLGEVLLSICQTLRQRLIWARASAASLLEEARHCQLARTVR